MESLAVVYLGILVLAPLFALVERRWPERASPRRLRGLDVAYWLFVTPLVTGVLTRAATLGAIGVSAHLLASTDPQSFLASLRAASPIAALPFALQLLLALLVADAVGYVSHRARHRGVLWHFHAIHHSASDLDAQAAARMHPIDDMIDNVLVGGTILGLGFGLEVFLVLGPTLLLHTMLTHANVAWDFGPLRYVFVSPAFHRWHHALDRAGARGCNYAGTFAFIDLVGGTFHLPRGQAPEAFGSGEPIPERVLGQLAWPWQALARQLARRRL